jgi:LysM repeat protein
MVVSSYSDSGSSSGPSANEQAKERDLGTAAEKKARKREAKKDKLPSDSYTVKVGDTLASIAEKTGIPADKLQELNPELDPQTLQSGQKIKLRE